MLYDRIYPLIGKAVKVVEDAVLGSACGTSTARDRRAPPRRALPGLTLYHFQISPFSFRVRKAILDLALDIPMKDVLLDKAAWNDLVRLGGKDQVPCLRIQKDGKDTWMYESKAIVQYLKNAAK